MNPINAEYIESGTFQAGEEDCFNAGIKTGQSVQIYTTDLLEQRAKVAADNLSEYLALERMPDSFTIKSIILAALKG